MIQTQRDGKFVVLRNTGDKEPAFEAETFAAILQWSLDNENKEPQPGATEPPPVGSPPAGPLAVGDFVQWNSEGVDLFKKPKKLTKVEDGFGFVSSSSTGMPLGELLKVEKETRNV